MHVDHHPLVHDFPELRNELQRLRQSDEQFSRLAEEYEALDLSLIHI